MSIEQLKGNEKVGCNSHSQKFFRMWEDTKDPFDLLPSGGYFTPEAESRKESREEKKWQEIPRFECGPGGGKVSFCELHTHSTGHLPKSQVFPSS